ncbi:hypothetical protein [Nesterenkonia flava]|uniref:Uncharacterized protein n=1 Tax=Nesterenkonia flava TaxID=469799 RepID=A0ABU1FRX3_9MICC|nr:hypothetical protein [Nesterenkonia flava]MDR5711077.1 hypothetical protein [Nesterenkonia flava]
MARPVLLGICFATGLIWGALGTLIHGNLWIIGGTQTGLVLPWGAALALLIALMAQIWAGLTAGRLTETLVMGASTFTVASIAYGWPGPDQLMVPYSPQAYELVPGPVIASGLWWLGSAGVTLLAMVLVKWILARDAYRRAQGLRPRQPPPGGSRLGS